MYSFFIILTYFIRFRNDSTEDSFGKTFNYKTFDLIYRCAHKRFLFVIYCHEQWRKKIQACVFIPFTNFLSSQDRSGLDGWICVHKDFAFCLEDQVSDFLTHDETGLGAIDHQAVGNSVENSNKKWKNCWFTDNEKFRIAKYAANEGPIAAVKKFKKFHQNLKFDESTTRSLGQRYHDMQIIWLLYHNAKKKQKQVGRPLMVGIKDRKVQQNFLMIWRREGRVVNTVAVNTTTRVKTIDRNQEEHLKKIDLEIFSWAKSLFHRIGYFKRICTTSKTGILENTKQETNLLYLH